MKDAAERGARGTAGGSAPEDRRRAQGEAPCPCSVSSSISYPDRGRGSPAPLPNGERGVARSARGEAPFAGSAGGLAPCQGQWGQRPHKSRRVARSVGAAPAKYSLEYLDKVNLMAKSCKPLILLYLWRFCLI